ERRLVRAQQLARRGHEPVVGQALSGLRETGVGKGGPQARRVAEELIQPLEWLAGERILVMNLARADGRERGLILLRPGRLPVGDQFVDGSFAHCAAVSNTGSPSSGVEASA